MRSVPNSSNRTVSPPSAVLSIVSGRRFCAIFSTLSIVVVEISFYNTFIDFTDGERSIRRQPSSEKVRLRAETENVCQSEQISDTLKARSPSLCVYVHERRYSKLYHYRNSYTLKMTKVKSIVRPVVKEFQMNNCGFDHHSADDFVKSQWQTRTKSFIFLLYRCFIAAFYLAVVIYSMIDGFSNGLYFIYLTNWGIMLCMVTTMLGAILVCTWYLHPEFADRVKDSNEMPIPFKIYWGMHVITLILSMGITIIYWSVLYNDLVQVTAVNILTHAFNSVLMFVDLWIVAYPVRLLHMFLPVCFGLVYAIFSVIYYAAGGVDPAGKHYIYPILDWDYPGKAILTVIGGVHTSSI
ncbi:unnamed protein product [Hermetia illucens]|uniref:Protein rolling stone n=1 Tax=Hermetia illucens TaxID=343691 RepID=A0A7R8URA3_HERIL|nr:unnamed protein product [Hermetia illucens]